jgi:hypothetical protein
VDLESGQGYSGQRFVLVNAHEMAAMAAVLCAGIDLVLPEFEQLCAGTSKTCNVLFA